MRPEVQPQVMQGERKEIKEKQENPYLNQYTHYREKGRQTHNK
jgi:hypothetical protein